MNIYICGDDDDHHDDYDDDDDDDDGVMPCHVMLCYF